MIDRLLAMLAPHPCYGCGKIGRLLCDNCKYDIIYEPNAVCLLCGAPPGLAGLCCKCTNTLSHGWYVGEREGELRRIIDAYKFESKREAGVILADLLAERLDILPRNTRIVPVPTVNAHIRERGYDHAMVMAKELARRRNLRLMPVLSRATHTTQRGSSRKERMAQAAKAFKAVRPIDPSVPCLIIDDITTTGASLIYAARALKKAGARDVWAAVIARQPLD